MGSMMTVDKANLTGTWDSYQITFDNYEQYLQKKGQNKFILDFTDLLYASNYKGGNGSIQEPEFSLIPKLNLYSKLLVEIDQMFGQRDLKTLSEQELTTLEGYGNDIINLCTQHHIKGLGVPYCSALFHFYFPNLIPVIDRNVLLGLNVIKPEILQKSGQVWKIEKHSVKLIEKMYDFLTSNGKITLRSADRVLFSKGKIIYEAYKQHTKL